MTRTDGPPHRPYRFDVIFLTATEPHFHPTKTAIQMSGGLGSQSAVVVPEQGAGIGGTRGRVAPEEFPDRLPQLLSAQVPQRGVDSAEGRHGGALAAIPPSNAVHRVPQRFDLARIDSLEQW